jgi:hypothetical protein
MIFGEKVYEGKKKMGEKIKEKEEKGKILVKI